MFNCDKRKCYLQVKYKGEMTTAVFSDIEQTQPYVFSCDHVAGHVASQIISMSYLAWSAGELEQPSSPWDFKVVYLNEDAYPETEPESLEDANQLIDRMLKGLL